MSLTATAFAVPANRTPFTVTQPDGSKVTLSQRGDEFYHFYLTDDGKMVLLDGTGYYFAVPGADGVPVVSDILASDKNNRTAKQTALLNTIESKSLFDYASKTASRKRLERESSRLNRAKSPLNSASSNWPSGIGLFPGNSYPVTGSPKALIILVAYKDVSFSVTNAKNYFNGLLSEQGFSQSGATGSALDFFTDASNGLFTPDFDVLGPVTLNNNRSYYGANDSDGNDVRPAHMVRDAIAALDPTTDFSVYDTDGDGYIDNVYVIYAGQGEAAGGGTNTIWPHSWDIRGAGLYLTVDGKTVASYACSAEYLSAGTPDGIGTFCHEFSHVMGLPDLYTTDYNGTADSLTPGSYDLMDYGSYNNNSRTPPTYSAYERNAMGWCDIEIIEEGVPFSAELEHILTSNKAFAVATDKTNEFFLFENRQKLGWDAYLPGHGMLVWHIDYNESVWNDNEPNNTTHQYIDIVEAGGTANNNSSTYLAQYPFPGTKKVTSFTSATKPAFKSWSGKVIDAPITDIAENNGKISFNVCGGAANIVEKPICNFSESVVESENPVQVILSLSDNAESGDIIKYVYMHDDESDLVEGEYTAPITLSQSCEFEFWAQRGDKESEITNIHFYIGEKAPVETSYSIVYKSNGTDSSSALTSNDKYIAQCEEGADIASYNVDASNNVYAGSYGLKLSSSKTNGNLVLDLASDYQKKVKTVIVNAKKYGSDVASISVNNSQTQSLTSDLADYSFTFDDASLTQLSLNAAKRIYVKSITIVCEEQGNVETETVEAPVFSHESGQLISGSVVTISSSTPGASVYYTLDGETPTVESILYTDEGIEILTDVTIKAFAVKEGMNDSPVSEVSYTIKPENSDDNGESFMIVFSDGGNEGTLITADNFTNRCSDGADIASFGSAERVYFGATGLKFGSAKGNGTLVLNINDNYQRNVKSVKVMAKCYGNDAASININGLGDKTLTSDLEEYVFMVGTSNSGIYPREEAGALKTLTIESEKRMYVKSISFDVPTGVDAIETNEDFEKEYYNLQGIRVSNPVAGQIYICRQGNKTSKVLVR